LPLRSNFVDLQSLCATHV